MKGFWPTPAGIQSDPHMAKVMKSPKIVVSKTLKSAADEPNWKNVTILRDLNHDTITKLSKSKNIIQPRINSTFRTIREPQYEGFKKLLVSLVQVTVDFIILIFMDDSIAIYFDD